MRLFSIIYTGLCLFTVLLIACEASTSATDTQTDASPADSAEAESIAPVEENSPLLGTWQMVEMRTGDLIISESDLGLSLTHFTEQGTMIQESDDLSPLEQDFRVADSYLITKQEGKQLIQLLNKDSLVLSKIVDAEPIVYTYIRAEKLAL